MGQMVGMSRVAEHPVEQGVSPSVLTWPIRSKFVSNSAREVHNWPEENVQVKSMRASD
jgi:hypothetical protein